MNGCFSWAYQTTTTMENLIESRNTKDFHTTLDWIKLKMAQGKKIIMTKTMLYPFLHIEEPSEDDVHIEAYFDSIKHCPDVNHALKEKLFSFDTPMEQCPGIHMGWGGNHIWFNKVRDDLSHGIHDRVALIYFDPYYV